MSVRPLALLVVPLLLSVWPAEVRAQSCRLIELAEPARQALRCARGFTVEIVRPDGRALDAAPSRTPRSIELPSGALLFQAPAGSNFRVRTPHAIATVRGTTFVVDVKRRQTDVFVSEGRVEVTRRRDDASVVLRAGEGVDVSSRGPLKVVGWGAGRVEALLARFGR